MDGMLIHVPASQGKRQRPRTSDAELDRLLVSIEVDLVKWAEYVAKPGESRSFSASEMPTLLYTLAGDGELKVADKPAIPIASHCLVIVPPRHPFSIVAGRSQTAKAFDSKAETLVQASAPVGMTSRPAGDIGPPQIKFVGGCFRACYGRSVDLFARLTAPIVERFDDGDQVDEKLRSVLCELNEQQVGARVVAEALLKQILVMLLRRSLKCPGKWIERFALFGDPQIARALADMVAHPEVAHSVDDLSRAAGLSRSLFMARFAGEVGRPPMTVLRELRLTRAADLLRIKNCPIDRAARAAGYSSRSSFVRAFKAIYGCEPSAWKASAVGHDHEQ